MPPAEGVAQDLATAGTPALSLPAAGAVELNNTTQADHELVGPFLCVSGSLSGPAVSGLSAPIQP